MVITGIGVVTSIGHSREAVWQAIQRGECGVRRLTGVPCIPDGLMLGATVDVEGEFPGQLKNIPLCRQSAAEALADARIHFPRVDRDRFGCSIGAHMGDTDYVVEKCGLQESLIPPGKQPWWKQWLPNTACAMVAQDYRLGGPRLSNSTACASGTIAILKAVRSIRDGQCDIALAGSSEAIHPLFAAGFYNMGVLADHADPALACRPFDLNRTGFVMGEGAAMFVLERLEHAQERGAAIYAEILGGRILSDARHVTSLDANSDALDESDSRDAENIWLVSARCDVRQRARHGHEAKRPARKPRHSRRIRPGGQLGVRQRQQGDARPLGERIRQCRAGDHGAGASRWLRAADAQSHSSRSGVRSRLHPAHRPRAAARARAQTLDRVRRPSGRHRAPPLDRPRSVPGAHSPSRGSVTVERSTLRATVLLRSILSQSLG